MSVISALRPLSGLRAGLTRSSFPVMNRFFSTTSARSLRAIFTETKNDELNTLLSDIQDKIILPTYLPERQRKIVFNPKQSAFLQQNPIVIEVDGLEHKFTSIDRFHGLSNSKKLLNLVLGLMQDSGEWSNLPILLAGYKKAGIRLGQWNYARITRVAGQSGKPHIIIDCAEEAKKTGFFFNNKEVLAQLLTRINEKVTRSGEDALQSQQAAKWTEEVLDIMQRPEHLDESIPAPRRLHKSPVVRGLMLFAQASGLKAKEQAQSLDAKDRESLAETVELVKTLWEDNYKLRLYDVRDLAELNPDADMWHGVAYNRALSGSVYVQVIAQNMKGFEWAQELLGDVADGLRPIHKALEDHLEEFSTCNRASTAGSAIYQKVTGRWPKWGNQRG